MYNFEDLSIKDKIAIIAVIFRVLWPPLQVWYIHADGAGILSFYILLVAFVVNINEIINTALYKPLTIYIILAVYMILNGLLMGSAEMYPKGGDWIIITHLITPILSMMIIANCAIKNFDGTVKWIAYGLTIYCILCMINSAMDDRGRLNAEINANEIALSAAICYGLYLLLYLRQAISTIPLLLAIIPALIIVLTGSRMGLAMIALMSFAFAALKIDLKNATNLLGTLVLIGSLVGISIFIMDNTIIGERMMGTTTDHENMTLETGTILDYYGDRGFQYYFSWPVFLEHPLFGVGFHQWQRYSPTGHVCHSEYMVQYVECGLVAFLLFLSFWYFLMKDLNYYRKILQGDEKNTILFLIVILVAIIYSNSVLWSYNMICVFTIYALAYAYPNSLTSIDGSIEYEK